MSALGQKPTYAAQNDMSALHPIATAKADIGLANGHVRFTPESRHVRCTSRCLLWARSGSGDYSITSSARPIRVLGTVRPSALAVFRLMINSTLVDCWTGKSAGFSPLRIRPV